MQNRYSLSIVVFLSTDDRRKSETENQSESKVQDKDTTEDDLDLGIDDEKTDDISDNQENEE